MKVSIHNERPKSYIVCDTETTGLNSSGDRLLEVAILRVDNLIPSEPVHKVIRIPFKVPENITKLTGINDVIVEEEGEPLDCVLDWVMEECKLYSHVIGHNFFLFDHHFIVNESKRIDHPLRGVLTLDKIIDTAALFKGWGLEIPRKVDETHFEYARWVFAQWVPFKYNLQHACEELEIDISGITLHRAGGDVFCTYKLYDRLQRMDI